MMVNVISPTRGKCYTLAEVLAKGIERRGIDWVSVNPKLQHICFYGSRDIAVYCDSVGSMESQWNNSVDFIINGIIPMHQTNAGKLSVGFGCNCDLTHCGQFPSKAPPSNKNWAKYKNQDLGEILIWTNNESQSIIKIGDILQDEKSCKILTRILKQIFAEEFLGDAVALPNGENT